MASGEVAMRQDTVSCTVQGGVDGATKNSTSNATTITLPVAFKEAEVRAYIAKDVVGGTAIIDKIAHEINKSVESLTNNVVKKPISTGSSYPSGE